MSVSSGTGVAMHSLQHFAYAALPGGGGLGSVVLRGRFRLA